MKQVLFLCTGNYYRSRYAEILFNNLAPAAGLSWKADSPGLDLNAGAGNLGPISRFAVQRLERRGIALPSPLRFPQQAIGTELAAADLVIALKEAEHRPMVAARFAPWAERVNYWHVHDVDQALPDEALALIDTHIEELLERLAAGGR